MQNYELAIIGAGPGGYTAGLLAGNRGLKVALVEKGELGGVCLNSGCIPTKFLLHASNLWSEIARAEDYGISIAGLELNYSKLMQGKENLISGLRKGIEFLLKARKVDLIRAQAQIVSPNKILLKGQDKEEIITADKIIISAGSSPLELKGFEFDHKDILSSDSILELPHLPESLLIIGGGVIGVEFGVYFSSLGTKVYLVELLDRILPGVEPELSRTLELSLKKLGLKIYTQTEVESYSRSNSGLEVKLANGEVLEVKKILVAVSRRANTQDLWQDLDLELERGFLKVNQYLQTRLDNVYAIGDIKGGFMLAHSASYEAKIVLHNIEGEKIKPDYSALPLCIFSEPEIASVGLTQREAEEKGLDLAIAKFPFRALGKARTIAKTEGFVKLIGDRREKLLLGAHLIGPFVTEIINELSLAIKFKIPYSELSHLIHPHPTIGEAIHEAIQLLNQEPIHYA